MLSCLSYYYIVAIFYPFSQFCEINTSLLSLQKQPNTAPNLFQRGVEYGEYVLFPVEQLLAAGAAARPGPNANNV